MHVGQLRDQVAELVILLDPAPDGGLEVARDVELFRAALEANGEDERPVPFALDAVTVGLAAQALAHEDRAVQEALAV